LEARTVHGGRKIGMWLVSVGFSRFHEGSGAGKNRLPGGHRLVNRKKIATRKTKDREKE